MTDINLQNGCELWATFDTEDVDASRGIVRDRSGKGRTLEASGGPTYGQPSPVGEAVSLDGTDDFFEAFPELSDTYGSGSSFTVVGVIKPLNDSVVLVDNSGNVGGFDKGWFVNAATNNNVLEVAIQNSSFTNSEAQATLPLSEGPTRFIAEYNDPSLVLQKPNETAVTTASGGATPPSTEDRLSIGREFGNDRRYYEGDISFLAVYSRSLTEVEKERFFDITDRMVSRL